MYTDYFCNVCNFDSVCLSNMYFVKSWFADLRIYENLVKVYTPKFRRFKVRTYRETNMMFYPFPPQKRLLCPSHTHTLRIGRIVADKNGNLPQNLRARLNLFINLRIQLPIDTDRYGWLRINAVVSGYIRSLLINTIRIDTDYLPSISL